MEELIRFFNENNIKYEENVSFKTLTTYKTGGYSWFVVTPSNLEILIKIIEYLKDNDIDYAIFGNGSNILASDEVYEGVIIKLSLFNEFEITDNELRVGSGYSLSKMSMELVQKNFAHFAGLCGIPGTVGGAIIMNAGAFGDEIKDSLISVRILKNSNIEELKNEDLKFGKRYSILKDSDDTIIIDAKFKLEKSDEDELEKCNQYKIKRSNTQPLDKPNCGSVFKNPEGFAAGKLIEDSGLKGLRIGGAVVSTKHANFILNDDNASSSDVYKVLNKVKDVVYEKYNIILEPEVKLFNFKIK